MTHWKSLPLENAISMKIFSSNEDEMKTFQMKEKELRECTASRPGFQIMRIMNQRWPSGEINGQDGILNLLEGMKTMGNGKYVGKCERLFSPDFFRVYMIMYRELTTLCCGAYNVH